MEFFKSRIQLTIARMDYSKFLLIVCVPVFVFLISNMVKYLAIEAEGQDRIRAIDDLLSDIGLDSFYIGISVFISTLIVSNNVTPDAVICLMCYSLLSSVIATLYNYTYEKRSRNWCFILGIAISIVPILYAIWIMANL